ncbi:hypothetical protein OUY_04265 [Wolbachia endosymbiont of Leptopilina clavipes]|nr:hypothetical protein OUY_04265 [Wolbachia endosymbiont of Leptopilina clavipes]
MHYKEKFNEQSETIKGIYEKLKEFELPPAYNEALESPCSITRILQDANAEFAATEGYAQYEFGYL